MKQQAYNDKYIEEVINSDIYQILPEGKILSRRSKQGYITNEWREVGNILKGGFRQMKYIKWNLFVGRIVYRKFIGPLDQNLNITYKDGNKLNCSVDNIEMVEQKQSNFNRYDKDIYNNPAVIGNTRGPELKEKVREMYRSGMGYKLIKKQVKISLSTLSLWLRDLKEEKDAKIKAEQEACKKKFDNITKMGQEIGMGSGKTKLRKAILDYEMNQLNKDYQK